MNGRPPWYQHFRQSAFREDPEEMMAHVHRAGDADDAVADEGLSAEERYQRLLGPQPGRYRPDVLVVPPDPGIWGADHVHGKDTLLVVEVVSKSSAHDDHEVKPHGCAHGKVPLTGGSHGSGRTGRESDSPLRRTRG
jgi:hypothetical protein